MKIKIDKKNKVITYKLTKPTTITELYNKLKKRILKKELMPIKQIKTLTVEDFISKDK